MHQESVECGSWSVIRGVVRAFP